MDMCQLLSLQFSFLSLLSIHFYVASKVVQNSEKGSWLINNTANDRKGKNHRKNPTNIARKKK